MFCLDNINFYNAKFNLALEEVLFDLIDEDLLILWQNSNSVIIGRNQITQNEIDQEFINKNNIEVVKRLSGGGAVYHDLGNLNFSIITEKKNLNFLKIILKALQSLDPEIKLSGRNDLLLNNYKISGLSQRISQNKILIHGTILINSNLNILEKALSPDRIKLEAKGINSVRSRVNNLTSLIKRPLTIDGVKNSILNEFSKEFEMIPFNLNSEIIDKTIEIKNNKYIQKKWNYRKTNSTNKRSLKFNQGLVSVSFTNNNDRIKNLTISGDFFSKKNIESLQNFLEDIKLLNLREKLKNININDYIDGITEDEFLRLFRGV